MTALTALADVRRESSSSRTTSVSTESYPAGAALLFRDTLQARFTVERPGRLIGDRAYDSDPLERELEAEGVELSVPHRSNRSQARTQDGRALRRYWRRWQVERLNAWLQNFRRIATRFEYHAENYLGFVHLGSIKILLRCYL